MNTDLNRVLDTIGTEHADTLQETSHFYKEVDIGRQAERLGLNDLAQRYRNVNAIVLVEAPDGGMSVRIDGRTFIDYAQLGSKVVVPGRVARETGRAFKSYTAMDSMVLVF
ncbi:MAG: hypothetical protein V2L15_05940 [Desulfobacteraceae bacterium]|jgi:hypothetical protein|nr:hypothetical protein [Desulfobacteraceae bacterium]